MHQRYVHLALCMVACGTTLGTEISSGLWGGGGMKMIGGTDGDGDIVTIRRGGDGDIVTIRRGGDGDIVTIRRGGMVT